MSKQRKASRLWEAVGTSVLAQTLATLGDVPNHHVKGVGTPSHGPMGLLYLGA